MKRKQITEPDKKRGLSIEQKRSLKAFVLALMMAGGSVLTYAEAVWARIIDIIPITENFISYSIDKDGDGVKDGELRLHLALSAAPSLSPHMQIGNNVLVDVGDNDYILEHDRILRFKTQDGRTIKVTDLVGNLGGFQRVRDFEAAVEDAAQRSLPSPVPPIPEALLGSTVR